MRTLILASSNVEACGPAIRSTSLPRASAFSAHRKMQAGGARWKQPASDRDSAARTRRRLPGCLPCFAPAKGHGVSARLYKSNGGPESARFARRDSMKLTSRPYEHSPCGTHAQSKATPAATLHHSRLAVRALGTRKQGSRNASWLSTYIP